MHSILARTPRSSLRGLLSAVVACALATVAAGLLLRVFDLSNVVALFLFTVVLVAWQWGKLAGAAAARVGVLRGDFFFVRHRPQCGARARSAVAGGRGAAAACLAGCGFA